VQDNIYTKCKNNPKNVGITSKLKQKHHIDIRYVKDDGFLSFAKTDEDKAIIICNYFLSVFNIEGDSSFDLTPYI